MLNSIASFIFGPNSSAITTNSEVENPQPTGEQQQEQQQQLELQQKNTILVTPSSPSVTGSVLNSNVNVNVSVVSRGGKRGKNNKRNKNKQKNNNNNKHKLGQAQLAPGLEQDKENTKLDSFDEEDFDENDWCIVEKERDLPNEADAKATKEQEEEQEEDDSENASVPVVENAAREQQPQPQEQPLVSIAAVLCDNFASGGGAAVSVGGGGVGPDRRPLQNQQQQINSHSLYSGPRPQQQRNNRQRSRNNAKRSTVPVAVAAAPPATDAGPADARLNVVALRAPRTFEHEVSAEGCVTQSLYVAGREDYGGLAASIGMEESWFVTPPPCFTSIGPIHMETSPFENLLIEHPSMSVYHSIRSAQEATESFVNLDLGLEQSQQLREAIEDNPVEPRNAIVAIAANSEMGVAEEIVVAAVLENEAVDRPHNGAARLDRNSATQLKQLLLARNGQKNREQKDRQGLCRAAMKRANKVRDFQGNGNRQRRSDMQHSKLVSGANNNRKCCF